MEPIEARLNPDQAKARKAIAVPLSVNAVNVIREQIGKHSTHVFSYQGNSITQVNTKAWRSALVKVGIKEFRWHDLRHTAASYLAMAGVSLVEISKILGHRTMQMVSRYSHLSDGHIVATGEKLAQRLGI